MFVENELYKEDVQNISQYNLEWESFKNKKILITGSTGLISTFIIDVLMYRNSEYNDNITIYAMGRNRNKAEIHFGNYFNSCYFKFIQQDILNKICIDEDIDYIIHGASNTHPLAYATQPIDTILLSVIGTKNVLDFASTHKVKKTIFLSTVEIYGENNGDIESFTENYCGYIDCNTLRAGYPEGKRAAESLCQAYINEKNLNIVIARCCRVYGPTMSDDDSKVIAQFLRQASNNKSIVLKSRGDQQYSYCYVSDICSALFVLLLKGNKSEAYNISDSSCNLTLLQIAELLSTYIKKEVVFDIPDTLEKSGYSKVTQALLNNKKILNLGWKPQHKITDGLIRTIEILKTIKKDAC